ncbi:uncharacterized protein V2V93DRAFT_129890 [Kockiozyma suomiensis]|uniref:uncharacterized protein n=1 Tax=Kockiozyma suomiensis TaxID=1337062 RepID=UPI00334415F1
MSENAASFDLRPNNYSFGNVFKTLTRGLKSSYTSASVDGHATISLGDRRKSKIAGVDLDVLTSRLRDGETHEERIAAANSFATAIKMTAVSDSLVETWYAAQDMLNLRNPREVRCAAWRLLNMCVLFDVDDDSTSVNKLVYYRAVVERPVSDDFDLQLTAFKSLTKDGRELPVLGPSESPFVLILSTWLRVVFKAVERSRPAQTEDLPDHEKDLRLLCSYTVNVIKFNYYAFDESDIVSLLRDILAICRRSSSMSDTVEGIAMISTLTVYGNLPISMLKPSVETLCSASNLVPELLNPCWDAIRHLVNSHLANNTIVAVYDILRDSEPNRTSAVKGSILFLQKLLEYEPEKTKTYNLTINSVMKSYRAAMNFQDNIFVDLAVASSMSRLILNDDTYKMIGYDDFKSDDSPLLVVMRSAERVSLPVAGENAKPVTEETEASNLIMTFVQQIMTKLYNSFLNETYVGPPDALMSFFLFVNMYAHQEVADLVIDFYEREYLCFPSSSGWEVNCRALLDAFLGNQERSYSLRLRVIRHMVTVYKIAKEVCEEEVVDRFLRRIFDTIAVESDMNILAQVVDFGVEVASTNSIDAFEKLVEVLYQCMKLHAARALKQSKSREMENKEGALVPTPPPALPPPSQTSSRTENSQYSRSRANSNAAKPPPVPAIPPNEKPTRSRKVTASQIIARAFVIIFVNALDKSGEKCGIMFRQLLKIARNATDWDPETIIIIYRLIFRIRVNSASRVMLLHPSDMDGFAESLAHYRPSMTAEALVEVLWTYPEESHILGVALPARASFFVTVIGSDTERNTETECGASDNVYLFEECVINRRRGTTMLNMSAWLQIIIQQIRDDCDWEVYSFIIAHLAPQISNVQLFVSSRKEIRELRSTLCDQIAVKISQNQMAKRVTKADIQVIFVRSMSSVIAYHSFFSKIDQDTIVKSVLLGLGGHEKVAAASVHCLLVCCHEFPISIKRVLSQIFTSFQTKITNSGLSVHILEFLSALARIPSLTSNFTQDDFKRVFAMAFKYVEHANDMSATIGTDEVQNSNNRVLLQYLIALAHNVVTTWFLTMRLTDRRDLMPFIVRGLLLANGNGPTAMPETKAVARPRDERTWASIDLITRFMYSDTELKMHQVFMGVGRSNTNATKDVVGTIWLHGLSIVSIESYLKTGISNVVVRRPTGTTSFSLLPDHRMLPTWDEQPEVPIANLPSSLTPEDQLALLPPYFFTELVAPLELQSTLLPLQIPNPSDPQIVRALQMYDRTPVVEFHKIGIIYMGLNQTSEQEILANSVGSKAYLDFLDGMGQLIRLKGNKQVYTGGLDTENDVDGEYAYAWKDKITQAIFHCTTLMPNRRSGSEREILGGSADSTESLGEALYDDESLSNKKRHIGNNFVNIYWNESGRPFEFDIIKSQFNFINIVISPHTKAASSFSPSSSVATALLGTGSGGTDGFDFFKVRVYVKPEADKLALFAPASHLKLIGKSSLPFFVRSMALNADIFAVVWHMGPGDEYLSNWQYRVRQTKTLKERIDKMKEKARDKELETVKASGTNSR